MDMKLTKEQQKLVEDNHDLVFGFLRDYHLSYEDWYDVACIGLCITGLNWDKEKGKFSTLAYKNMYNEYGKIIQYSKRLKRKEEEPVRSLNMVNNEDKYEYGDTISNGIDYEELSINSVCLNRCVNKLNAKQKQVLDLHLSGKTLEQIGKIIGITLQGAMYRLQKARQIIKQEYALESI